MALYELVLEASSNIATIHYWSKHSQSIPDSKGGNINPASQWLECQRLSNHLRNTPCCRLRMMYPVRLFYSYWKTLWKVIICPVPVHSQKYSSHAETSMDLETRKLLHIQCLKFSYILFNKKSIICHWLLFVRTPSGNATTKEKSGPQL